MRVGLACVQYCFTKAFTGLVPAQIPFAGKEAYDEGTAKQTAYILSLAFVHDSDCLLLAQAKPRGVGHGVRGRLQQL